MSIPDPRGSAPALSVDEQGVNLFVHLSPSLLDLLRGLMHQEGGTAAAVMRRALVAYSQKLGRS